MTNYEELEKAIETMNKLDEAPWEMQYIKDSALRQKARKQNE